MNTRLIPTYNNPILTFGEKKYFVGIHTNHNLYEKEQDKFIGKQIENARDKLTELHKTLQKTTNRELKKNLEKEILIWKEKFEAAANELTTKHLRFALKSANEYRYLHVPFDDLVSSASIGIYKAAKKYSPSKYPDVHFLSYARFWIKQQIFSDLAEDNTIKIPIRKIVLKRKIKQACQILEKELNRAPYIAEISQYLGIPIEEIKTTLQTAELSTISLNSQINTDSDASTFEDLISDTKTFEEEEQRLNEDDLVLIKKAIDECLDPKEKYIIEERYKLNKKGDNTLETLENIAKKLNLTKERIRQIENIALDKIRAYCHNSPEKNIQQKKLKEIPKTIANFASFEALVSTLSKGENSKTTEKIRKKLSVLSPAEFEKILRNTTNKKRCNVIISKYLNNGNYSYKSIGEKLELSPYSVKTILQDALKDLKKFLLIGKSLGYASLKEDITANTHKYKSTPSYIKRVQRATSKEINNIMKNLLSDREFSFISKRYMIGEDLSSGYTTRSTQEIASIFKTSNNNVKSKIHLALLKLREYFSKPQKHQTNLARFAKDICALITNPEKKKMYYNTIINFKKQDLEHFLEHILTNREIIFLTQRYNLHEFNTPQTISLTNKSSINKHIQGVNSKTGLNNIEKNIFYKFEKFFNSQIPTHLEQFAEKVSCHLQTSEQQNSVQKYILSLNTEDIKNFLNKVLIPEEIKVIQSRFNIDKAMAPIKEQTSRTKLFTDSDFSSTQAYNIEKRALKKLRIYLTFG